MNLIELKHAELGYPGYSVVQDVSLQVQRGDSVVLCGPNGSGKSTLLRTLLGTISTLSGECVRAPGLRLSYVPQQVQMDPIFPLRAREIIAHGAQRGPARPRRLDAQQHAAIETVISRFDLGAVADRLFARLSGGQKQRVLFARALVEPADLIILDEPTSGVDQGAEEMIFAELTQLPKSGTAVIHVTHDAQFIADFMGSIWRTEAGRFTRTAGVAPAHG